MKKYLLLLLIPTLALAAGRLQNSDFMTEAEITGAGGAVSQLLNDSKIYVTAGSLNKTLDDAIADGDIGTPLTAKGNLVGYATGTTECVLDKTDGKLLTVDSTASCGFDFKDPPVSLPDQTGNTGKYLYTTGVSASWRNTQIDDNETKDNLLECSGFDGCAPEGIITNGAGIDFSGTTTRTVEASAWNTSKLNLNQSAASTLDYTYTKTANFEGKQMIAYCEIKTANTGVTFNSMIDGVVQSTLSVSSDNSWKYYKIPFVGGATSQGYKVDHVTATEIPDIDIDNCFIGKASNVTREIGSASFVGSLRTNSDTGCSWTVASTTYASFPLNGNCTFQAAIGNVLEPTTKIPAVRIPNAKTNGVYKVVSHAWMYTSSGTDVSWALSDGTNRSGFSAFNTFNDQKMNGNSIIGTFKFSSGGDKEIKIIAKSSTSIAQVYSDVEDRHLEFDVYFYPDDTSTIVTQDTELTAKTANELSGNVNSSGTMILQNYPTSGITSSRQGVGDYQINYASLGLTSIPKVTCDTYSNVNISCRVVTRSLTEADIRVEIGSTGDDVDSAFTWGIDKLEADVNKSATIVGKFEQVEEVNKEVTASEANVLSVVLDAATCAVENENFSGWITNTTDSGASVCNINYSGLGLTVVPALIEGSQFTGGGAAMTNVNAITTSSANIYCINSTNGALSTGCTKFNLILSKQGADVNKNLSGVIINASKAKQEIADIVKEDIVSSDLISIKASRTTIQTIPHASTTPVIFNVVDDDNSNGAYNPSNGEFTSPKSANYEVCASMLWDIASWSAGHVMEFSVQNVTQSKTYYLDRFEVDVTKSAYYPHSNCAKISANKDDVLRVRVYQSSGSDKDIFLNKDLVYMSIDEMPTTESVLKSLVGETTTKCQTKTTTTLTSSSGQIAALTFTGLDTNKNYSFVFKGNSEHINTSSGDKYVYINTNDPSLQSDFQRALSTVLRFSHDISTPKFKPATSTVYVNINLINAMYLLSGASATICELPDTYVETTEF